MNKKKIKKVLDSFLKELNSANLSVAESITLYANIGYSMGDTLYQKKHGVSSKELSIETLNQTYYSQPTIDVALILQSLLTASWAEDIHKLAIGDIGSSNSNLPDMLQGEEKNAKPT